jgi:hypothetical protein
LIATIGPALPFILLDCSTGDRRPVGADDCRRGTSPHRIIAIAHGQICAAIAHRQRGPPTVRRHVNPVVSLIEKRNHAGRRIDFIDLAGAQVPHMHVDRAFVNPDLRDRVADLTKVQRGERSDSHRRRTEMYLGARAGVGPECVTRRQWIVERRRRPIAGP